MENTWPGGSINTFGWFRYVYGSYTVRARRKASGTITLARIPSFDQFYVYDYISVIGDGVICPTSVGDPFTTSLLSPTFANSIAKTT